MALEWAPAKFLASYRQILPEQRTIKPRDGRRMGGVRLFTVHPGSGFGKPVTHSIVAILYISIYCSALSLEKGNKR